MEPEDASILATAQREAREETGLELCSAWKPHLINIDVHHIPAHKGEPEHFHHDLVFLLLAKSEEILLSEESNAIVWCPIEGDSQYKVDAPLHDSMRSSIKHLTGLGLR